MLTGDKTLRRTLLNPEWLCRSAATVCFLITMSGGANSLAQESYFFAGNSCSDASLENSCTSQSSCDSSLICGDLSCVGGCDSAVACDSDCGKDGLGLLDCLQGVLKPSDYCFDDFISPMINFVFFEDPRNVTELRPIYVNHWVPPTVGNGISADGNIQLFAAQFRVKLTDRLSLIAVKDGFIVDDTRGTLGTLLSDGWADVTAGLKYNLIRDAQKGRLLSIGGTYELPIGSTRSLQDIGDGEFHVFATGGQRLAGGNAHLLSSVGYRFPVDNDIQTSALHWSNHFDVRLTKKAYVFTELAWWHWTEDAANGAAIGIAGQDLFNLFANDVAGNDLVTQNVGLKLKPNRNIEAGIAYEFPLTAFKDVIDNRIQTELILRY